MKDILQNLALILTTNKCREMKVNCSGSHLTYKGRFKYSLISDATNKEIIEVTFYKNSVPTYIIF
jgi:hypothetical protein